MHSLCDGTDGSLHTQLTLHAEHFWVTSSPDVSMSKAIFSSAENAMHSELVLFFALYFVSLCPHTLQSMEIVIHTYNVYMYRAKPQRTSIIHATRSACSWRQKMRCHFRLVNSGSHMPPEHRCSTLTFQFSHQRLRRRI